MKLSSPTRSKHARPHSSRFAGIAAADVAGVVLLEVVLALVLFVGAAAVISTAINASLEGVMRQRLSTHAVDLAITVLSELQIGLRTSESPGPEHFAVPFEHWTWQMATTARGDRETEPSDLTLVEVIVRHDDPPFVYRLSQIVKLGKPPAAPTAARGANY